MKHITLTAREYSDLSPERPLVSQNAPALAQIRDRILSRRRQYHIETGRDLIKAKALLSHGEFGPWLKDNFDWSDSTAQNYMNAARLADENPEVAKLAPSAVIAIAAPGVPETVKVEVIAAVAAGKVPSTKEIKAKVAKAKAAKPAIRKEAGATVAALPKKEASASDKTPAETDDLVERLRAAGIAAARLAFEAAFPGYLVTDYDELNTELERLKAA